MFEGLFGSKKPTDSGSSANTGAPATTSNAAVENKPLGLDNEENLSPKLKLRRQMLAEIRANMADFESSVNAAKDLSSFSSTGLNSAKAMLKDVELDLDSQIRIEGENMLLRNRLAETEKLLEVANQDLAKESAIAESSARRLAEAQADLQSTKDRLVESSANVEELRLTIEQLQKAEARLEAENNHRKQFIAELEKENLSLNELVSKLQTELSTQRDAAIGNEKEANEWKRVNENTKARLEALQKDYQKLQLINNGLTRNKVELESQLDATKQELITEAKRVADQIRNKDAKIYSLESKNEVLEANSRIGKQKLDTISIDNSELRKQNTILEKQLEAMQEKVENTRRAHEQDREALYRSADRISDLDLSLTTTIAELNQIKSERDAYGDMVDGLNKKIGDLSEQLIKLSAVQDKHDQLVRAIRERGNVKSVLEESDEKVVSMKKKEKSA